MNISEGHCIFLNPVRRRFFSQGPKQAGKSTLLRNRYSDALWLDLLKYAELRPKNRTRKALAGAEHALLPCTLHLPPLPQHALLLRRRKRRDQPVVALLVEDVQVLHRPGHAHKEEIGQQGEGLLL